jgi:hypothetical protein
LSSDSSLEVLELGALRSASSVFTSASVSFASVAVVLEVLELVAGGAMGSRP